MGLIRSLRDTISQFGWKNGFWYLSGRALQSISSRYNVFKYYFVAQPVPPAPHLSALQGKNILVRQIERDDPVLTQMNRPHEVIKRRFDQGSICLGALKGDVLAGYLWLHFGPYMEDEVRCRFIPEPENESAWDFDVFVSPRHRLGFTFLRLWDEANAFLREHGARWTMSRISAFNYISLASHTKLGMWVLGCGLYIVLGRLQLTLSSARPRVHISFQERSAPTIHLRAPTRNLGNSEDVE